jgi:hypothetical protein
MKGKDRSDSGGIVAQSVGLLYGRPGFDSRPSIPLEPQQRKDPGVGLID